MSNDDTIDTLNDLIETSKDGEYGSRESAEYLRDNQIRQLFPTRAEGCRKAAADPQTMVGQLGGTAEASDQARAGSK